LLAPFTNKGKEVSLGFCLELILELKTENRWNNLGPTGTGFVTGAAGIGHVACGHWKGSVKRAATIAQLKSWFAPSTGTGCPSGNGGIDQRDCGPGRRVGWK